MTWVARVRLSLGVIAVLLAVAGLTLLLSQRLAQATSVAATIKASEIVVGSDYAGHVVTLDVEAGEHVEPGDVVATISSPMLQSEVANGLVDLDGSAVSLDEQGYTVLRATEPGLVTEVGTRAGSFVTAGSTIAVIEVDGTRFIEATVELAPRDYARLVPGAGVTVILPDQRTLSGQVGRFAVTNDGDHAEVTVQIVSPELTRTDSAVTASGTPVVASIELRDDGALAYAREGLEGFLRKIGL